MSYNHEDQETGQKEKDSMTVLVVEPLKKPYMKTIPKGLRSLQKEVGGLIDATYPFVDPVAIVLNDEGKLNGMTPNRGLYDCDGELYDIIMGPFLVVGMGEEEFGSLSEEMSAKYMEKYKVPEMLFQVNGELKMIPVPEDREKETEQSDQEPKNGKDQKKKSRKRSRADEGR